MNRLVLLFVTGVFFVASTAHARPPAPSSGATGKGNSLMDYVKGCLIMAGVSAGATSMAVSQSGAKIEGSSGVLMAAGAGCLIGSLISGDVKAKAEMRITGPAQKENSQLRIQYLSIQQDICIIKGECDLDGTPFSKERIQLEKNSVYQFKSIESGN